MKHKRTQVNYLLDILDNVEKAQRFIEGVTQEDFEANDEKVYAVVHALQSTLYRQLVKARAMFQNLSVNVMRLWTGSVTG